jgi:hypothetical protein
MPIVLDPTVYYSYRYCLYFTITATIITTATTIKLLLLIN